MIENYLKIIFRTSWRRKAFSLINICGLSIGIAACILIVLYTQNELTYDSFHEHSAYTYRVTRDQSIGGKTSRIASSNYALMDLMVAHLPEISHSTRLAKRDPSRVTIVGTDHDFIEDRFFLADSTVFDVFSIEFIHGNPKNALREPTNVVITERMSEQYFGNQNALGKLIEVDGSRAFTITGVVKPFPANSHVQFDFLASLSSVRQWYPARMLKDWGDMWLYTYVVLLETTDPYEVERQLVKIADQFGPSWLSQYDVSFSLQPLESIHLFSKLIWELAPGGSIVFVRVFILVGLLVLLIACFNFINLSTARASWRLKEIGVRKVVGAVRHHLLGQFLLESLVFAITATIIALFLVLVMLPLFNQFTDKTLSLGMDNLVLWFGLLLIVLAVGILSGLAPALMLSGFRPSQVLKGSRVGSNKSGLLLRKVLVVFQFFTSIILVAGTLMVYQQLDFMRDRDLGFNSEQIVVVPLNSAEALDKVEILKGDFETNSHVRQVSAVSNVPPRPLNSWAILPRGAPKEEVQSMEIMSIDYDYLELMDIEVVQGRPFERDNQADLNEGMLINQAGLKQLGLKDPVGTQFESGGSKNFQLVGIVKDFHFYSLHQEIKPMILHIWPSWHRILLVKLKKGDLTKAITSLGETWNSVISDWDFEYYFLDDTIEMNYQAEERLGQLIFYFACLAIVVASLGLFGLAAFMAEQRTKEIGIRKVMGASITGIIWLQLKSFVRLITFSFILAIPATHYLINTWLDHFAYRTSFNPGILVISGIVALFIAATTVGHQSFKAATANPVDCLKAE